MAGLLDALFQGRAPAGLLGGGGGLADALSPGRERRRTEELRKLMLIDQMQQSMKNSQEELKLKQKDYDLRYQQANRPEIILKDEYDPARGGNASIPLFIPPDRSFVRQLPVDRSRVPGGVPPQMGGAPQMSGGQMPPPGAIPPAPYGSDADTYRKKMSEDAAREQSLQGEAKTVFGILNKLEQKTRDPKFAEAAGPFASAASEDSYWSPKRWAYEAWQSPAAKGFLDQVKQDESALDAIMQRALLKGMGSADQRERAAISQIKGKIQAARSPEAAQELLNNYRGIVRTMFKVDDATIIKDAQSALAAGAPPEAVTKRIRALGGDPKKVGL
jgi:hypothetical protein